MERDSFVQAISDAWQNKSSEINWWKLEVVLFAILQDDAMSDRNKLAYVKQAIDAFTKHKWFYPPEYTITPEQPTEYAF